MRKTTYYEKKLTSKDLFNYQKKLKKQSTQKEAILFYRGKYWKLEEIIEYLTSIKKREIIGDDFWKSP